MAATLLGANEDKTDGGDNRGIRTYNEFYKVLSDRGDTAYAAGSAIGIPRIGDFHSQDPNAYCHSVIAKVTDSPLKKGATFGFMGTLWEVHCQYTTENTTGVTGVNPLTEGAKVVWSGETYARQTNRDKDGNVVKNSAHLPIKSWSVDETRPIAKITKNVSGLPITSITTWPDSINSSSFSFRGLTVPEKTAMYKFDGLSELKYRNNIAYYTFTFSLHFREDWKRYFPNVGKLKYGPVGSGSDYGWLPVQDWRNAPTSSAMPLAIDGSQLIFDTPNVNDSALLYIEVESEKELNFQALSSYLV